MCRLHYEVLIYLLVLQFSAAELLFLPRVGQRSAGFAKRSRDKLGYDAST